MPRRLFPVPFSRPPCGLGGDPDEARGPRSFRRPILAVRLEVELLGRGGSKLSASSASRIVRAQRCG